MQKISISGGFSSNEKFGRYAEIVGSIYGGGEYAVPDSDLFSITPDVTNQILVIGNGSVVGKEKPIEPHSASTVEIELRNLFQFPKRANKIVKPKKVRAARKNIKHRAKKGGSGGSSGSNDGTNATTSTTVQKLRDVEEEQLNKLIKYAESENKAKDTVHNITDDYLIAEEIDKQMKDVSSESSEGESESESSNESEDESGNESEDDSSKESDKDENIKGESKSTEIKLSDNIANNANIANIADTTTTYLNIEPTTINESTVGSETTEDLNILNAIAN